jgi:hypothetical protein
VLFLAAAAMLILFDQSLSAEELNAGLPHDTLAFV